MSESSSPAIDRPIGRRRGDRVVGAARATRDAVDQAVAAARSNLPVVITGPAGTGRGHLARAIHAWSERASAPFVVVSCAAIPEARVGREVFGCASNVHPLLPEEYAGALARAAEGTVLIEDIDRVPDAVARALSKAIAESRFQREGDGSTSPLRARVLATRANGGGASSFAELSAHEIELLPLSDRPEDVLPLAAHWLQLAADEAGIKPVGFTSEARGALLAESWPGNVQELGERIRLAVKLAGNGSITAEALLLSADGEEVPSFKEAKRAFETRYVTGLLRRCGGNISRAARLAKKDRKDFYDVIRRTGVDPADFR